MLPTRSRSLSKLRLATFLFSFSIRAQARPANCPKASDELRQQTSGARPSDNWSRRRRGLGPLLVGSRPRGRAKKIPIILCSAPAARPRASAARARAPSRGRQVCARLPKVAGSRFVLRRETCKLGQNWLAAGRAKRTEASERVGPRSIWAPEGRRAGGRSVGLRAVPTE